MAEEIKEEYFKQTRELLRDHPEEIRAFDKLWATGRVREAYIMAMEAIEKLHVTRSPEYIKSAEDFFWVYMH